MTKKIFKIVTINKPMETIIKNTNKDHCVICGKRSRYFGHCINHIDIIHNAINTFTECDFVTSNEDECFTLINEKYNELIIKYFNIKSKTYKIHQKINATTRIFSKNVYKFPYDYEYLMKTYYETVDNDTDLDDNNSNDDSNNNSNNDSNNNSNNDSNNNSDDDTNTNNNNNNNNDSKDDTNNDSKDDSKDDTNDNINEFDLIRIKKRLHKEIKFYQSFLKFRHLAHPRIDPSEYIYDAICELKLDFNMISMELEKSFKINKTNYRADLYLQLLSNKFESFKIIIEIDDDSHLNNLISIDNDMIKDKYFLENGYCVIRYPITEKINKYDINFILNLIRKVIDKSKPIFYFPKKYINTHQIKKGSTIKLNDDYYNDLESDMKKTIIKSNNHEKEINIYATQISFGTNKQKKKDKQNYNITLSQISVGSSKKK